MGKSVKSTGNKPDPWDLMQKHQADQTVIQKAEGTKPSPDDIVGVDGEKKNSGGSGTPAGGSGIPFTNNGPGDKLNDFLMGGDNNLSKLPPVTAPTQLPAEKKPSPQETSSAFLREDYLANKGTVDPFFTNPAQIAANYNAPVIPGATSGKVLPMMDETVIGKILDANNGDVNILSKYRQQRFVDLDNKYAAGVAELQAKYPERLSSGMNEGAPYRAPEYRSELAALQTDVEKQKAQLADAIGTLAAIKVVNKEIAQRKTTMPKLDPKKIGRAVREAVGDPTVARDKRYEQKGIPLDPASSYYNDATGYNAIQVALEDMDSKGADPATNEHRKILADNLKESKDRLMSDHSDFRKQQVVRAISDKIYKDKNWFQTMTGLYTINNDDIKKAGAELGIPEKYLSDIDRKDVKTANIFGTFVNEIGVRPGANIGAAGGRLVRKYLLGQDPDEVDAHYDQLKKSFTSVLADAPDAQSQFGNATTVQADPTKSNFLEDIQNDRAGKFNWNVDAIANTVSEGIAQMTQYGLGATGTGAVIQKLGLISDFDKARKAGLVAYGFLNAYDDSYQQARQVVGDDPGKEAARNSFATIRALTSAYTELIFPDYKVTDNLFGANSKVGQQLIDRLAKDGLKGMTQGQTKSLIIKGLKETAKDTGKEILEEEADLLGDVVTSALYNPSSLKDRNIPQEAIQTAVNMAISASVPIGLGQMRGNRETSPMRKAMVFNIGSSPAEYQHTIGKQMANSEISPEQGARKLSIVNTMAEIVQKDVPEVSPLNDKPLSEKDKIDYSWNLLHDRMLKEKIDGITDEVQIKALTEKRTALQTEREEMLNSVDGIERNFNGDPIFERDTEGSIINNKSSENEKQSNGAEATAERPAQESSSPVSNTAGNEATKEQTLRQGEGSENIVETGKEGAAKPAAPSTVDEDVSDDILPTKQREKLKTNPRGKRAMQIEGKETTLAPSNELNDHVHALINAPAGSEEEAAAIEQVRNQSLTELRGAKDNNQRTRKSKEYAEVALRAKQLGYDVSDLQVGAHNWMKIVPRKKAEEISFTAKRPYVATIDVMQHPNGMWTSGRRLDNGITGTYSGAGVYGDAYKTKEEAIKAELDNARKFFTPKEDDTETIKKNSPKIAKQIDEYEKKNNLSGVTPAAVEMSDTRLPEAEVDSEQIEDDQEEEDATPETKPAAKKETKPKAKSESAKADVSFEPLNNISTDVKRFQPRGTDFSQDSVDKIVNDYDENKMDPVVLFKDKNGKDFVLAGHSRFEAHKQLDAMPADDPRRIKAEENGFKPGAMKARYFSGTEEEAKEFADRSNDLGTRNKDYESANSLRNMKTSKAKIQDRAKTDFGKNWRYIYMLSRLNPNGKMLQLVKSLSDSPDVQTENEIKKAAQWIGSVRSAMEGVLTNAHEDEMTDFLLDKTNAKKFTREADFVQFMNNIAGVFDFNPEMPLNLERTKGKTVGQAVFENERDELEKDINAKQREYDRINERLNEPGDAEYVSPDDPDYQSVLQVADIRKKKLSDELVIMRRQLMELKGNKGKFLAQDMAQFSMFETGNLSPVEREELNAELEEDGIDTKKIEEYEAVNQSDSGQNTEAGVGNAEEVGPVQEDVPQSNDDKGASEVENQGSGSIQGQQRTSTSVADETAPVQQTAEEQKRAALEKKKAEFKATFNKTRSQLSIGIDPELLAKGIELIGAYVDLGMYKFGEIMRDVADTMGEKSDDLLKAMKGVYGAYLANNENDQLDDIATVRAYQFEPEAVREEMVNGIPIESPVANAIRAMYDHEPTVSSGFHTGFSKDWNGLKPSWAIIVKGEASPLLKQAAEKAGMSMQTRRTVKANPNSEVTDIYLPDVTQAQTAEATTAFNKLADEYTSLLNQSQDDFKPVSEAEHIAAMLADQTDPESREYYQDQLNLLNNRAAQYWKELYDTYDTEPSNPRREEALQQIIDHATVGSAYVKVDDPTGIEKVVSKDEDTIALNLDGTGMTNHIPHEYFASEYKPYYPPALEQAFVSNIPVQELHPLVDQLLNEILPGKQDFEAESIINGFVSELSIDDTPKGKKLAREIFQSLTGKKVKQIGVTGYGDMITALNKLYNNATSTSGNMESDRSRRGSENTVGETLFSTTRNANRPPVDGDAGQVIETGVPIQDSKRLQSFDATVSGERGNTELFEPEQFDGSAARTTESPIAGRSSEDDDSGVSSELDGAGTAIEDVTGATGHSFEELRQQQNAAEGTPYVALDLANIAASLPLLLPGQLNDVYKAENRFINHADSEDLAYGKGIMFTNGTGTGKTLTGGGIAKRFIQQGRGEITIVVPSDTKAKDWIEELAWLNIPVRQLADTKDAGKGVVVTTYANMRENFNLQQRKTDLVMYDESHKINSNGQGKTTSNEEAHMRMTKSPSIAYRQAREELNYDTKSRQLSEAGKYSEIKTLKEQVQQRAKQIFNQTKVVFLSATPFSYHKSLTYADGYLFKIKESLEEPVYNNRGYNSGNETDQFYMTNFGYRMRYNKLTIPETGVDVDLLERQFTENLKNKEIISSRKLDIDKDYSRQFIISSSDLGTKIDQGLSLARDHEKYELLPSAVNSRMNFLYTNQLMEAIKAKESIERYKQHLALGRKIVVFHNYIENQPGHPFDFLDASLYRGLSEDKRIQLSNEIENFNSEYPEYHTMDLKGLKSPIQTLLDAFGDKVVLFNGRQNKKDRMANVKAFNDDNSGKDIIVVQTEAGKEGISLHDKTGKRQRVESNLGLPYAPTTAIQTEGRIYRTGNKTNAVIEYPILNLNFERFAFASKISERVRTAENFAMGEEARNMETAFKEGYINAVEDAPSEDQGVGGKQDDARADKSSEFDKARTYYFKRAKRSARDKAAVTGDYYATPEPLGYKMVQWLNAVPNEKLLEPSAGHGAIARFMSKANRNVMIEPKDDLRSEVAMNGNGQVHAGTFEDLNIINKFDGIGMNPPFGRAGKTAMEHLEKAMAHLRDGGRIAALVPTGQMDERINDWLESDKSKNFYIRAKIKLPSVVFERAGTSVNTQILIIDRMNNAERAAEMGNMVNRDLTRYDNIGDFFEAIRDMEVPERFEPGKATAEEEIAEQNKLSDEKEIVKDDVDYGSMQGGDNTIDVVKGMHTKKNTEIYTARVNKRMSDDEFSLARAEAKKLDGYYSSYKGSGAIPGFIFQEQQAADKFAAMINGKGQVDPGKMSIADRIRAFKIGGNNAYSMLLPVPAVWNAAVELVAKAVEAGTALVDAMRVGMDYINKNNDKEWNKNLYNKEMVNALKDRGVFQYNLSQAQMNEADRVIGRVQRGANLVQEVSKIRAKYDQALLRLTDPADIADLNANYNEMDRYMFNSLAIQNIENNTTDIDLDLRRQTWWEKQKENWQNRFQRVEQVQKKITELGITIEEKNDMVNKADRWKSIAAAKIDDVLKEVGLSDVDVFAWKGRQKIDDSLFDQMAKKGVDYRKFNLYLYAKHAEERNAHNAKVRRDALDVKLVDLEQEKDDLTAKNIAQPSPVTQGLLTKKTNELAQYQEYRDAYSDPSINRNYVKMIERKIPARFRLMDDGGSGMLNSQAQEILQAVQDEGLQTLYSDFETLVREKIIDKILDAQRRYGLIAQEDYDQINGYYNNYVPLKVENKYFEDEVTFAQSGLPGAKMFKSKGANYIDFENRVNPMTQALIDLQAAIYEGEQNEYKKTIAQTIISAPDNKVWDLKSAEFAPIKDKQGRILQLREVNVPENGIAYNEDGQKKYLLINDAALAKELTGENVKAAIPVLAKVNAVFRSVYTVYNPSFTVTNLFRDMETAGIVMGTTQKSEVRRQFKRNASLVPKIILGSYKEQNDNLTSEWAQKAREYKDLGGNMTWFSQGTSDEMVKDIEGAYEKYQKSGGFEAGKNVALSVADFMNKASQAVETSTRLAMYDALVKSGVEKYKAVEIARNATINFNKKGNFAGVTDSLYLFANATIQGTTNVLKTLLTTKRGRYMAGGIAVMGLLQSIINNAFDDCETDPANCYDNIPSYEKERYMILRNPLGRGFIKIPLAYGFNVFYNFGENMGQVIQGKSKTLDAAGHVLGMALNSFNPAGTSDTPPLQQLSPTATDPIVQWYTNRDGLGRKIYPDSPYDKGPDSQKTSASDTPAAKDFAAWLNEKSGGNEKVKGKIDVAPGTFDWIFETATGGMGQFIKQAVGSTVNAFDPKVDVDPKQVPIINRFFTTPKQKNDKADIYETRDRSYNEILTPEEIQKLRTDVDKAVAAKQLDVEKATLYKDQVQRNQFKLNNQSLLSIVDRSSREEIPTEEIDAFVQELEEKAMNGDIPEKWVRSYKAMITRNQNKLLKKENPEEDY